MSIFNKALVIGVVLPAAVFFMGCNFGMLHAAGFVVIGGAVYKGVECFFSYDVHIIAKISNAYMHHLEAISNDFCPYVYGQEECHAASPELMSQKLIGGNVVKAIM